MAGLLRGCARATAARVQCRRLSIRACSPVFALAPYLSSSHGSRKTRFCMLALRHPALLDEHIAITYEAKANATEDQVHEIFQHYDVGCYGSLDRAALTQAMEGIGLNPTEERAAKLLKFFDTSRDGALQRDEFCALMTHIWGPTFTPHLSDSLHMLYDDEVVAGRSAYVWLGRSVPSHYVLRALRNLWPGIVSHIAIMRNTIENPQMIPEHMTTFDETYEPSVAPELNNASLIAAEAFMRPPTSQGGFVVRITNPAGDVKFVPLRGLPENSLAAADSFRQTNPEGLPPVTNQDGSLFQWLRRWREWRWQRPK